MQAVILDGFLINPGDISWQPITGRCPSQVYDACQPEEAAARIGAAEIVYTNRCPITRQVFEACPQIRMVQSFGTGYNVIDTAAASEHGVVVCNVPAYSSHAVAQQTMALLLEIACGIAPLDRYCKEHGWLRMDDPAIARAPRFELLGKTMGIIGLGDIGQVVAAAAQALGMQVLAYQRHPRRELEGPALHFSSLEHLLSSSDVVSLHCPLTDETRGMIGRRELALMKPGAILLNTARGALVDEGALLSALESGHLLAAGLDVLTGEPAGARHPLVGHPRCVFTPHVGWAARETRQRLVDWCGENLKAFLAGRPVNQVNRL